MSHTMEFQPAWASPPGDTIRDLLLQKEIEVEVLASTLKLDIAEVKDLLDGTLPITERYADRLAKLLGPNQRFWIVRETEYRRDIKNLEVEDKKWIATLPFSDMVRYGWVGPAQTAGEKISQVRRFFDVSSLDEWKDTWLSERAGLTAYRTSPTFSSQAGAVVAWLRQGEIAAQQLQINEWSSSKFGELLPSLKSLTRQKNPGTFIPELQRRCAECGVAIVIVRAPKGCPASGATRVRDGRAILQLSARYLTDDHFWFTFFHEAAHLLLHNDRLVLEWAEAKQLNGKEEQEANEFAAKFLIPREFETKLRTLPKNYKSIMRFARDLSISPGIVVGQLQHRGILPHHRFNYLKKRFTWG